ncbi:pyridoxal-phosphate dependent enzyme [Fluviispira multicolorata]|uniref:Pyridoxal-phosphate dependent enzyme n=1 Tax=Fluviispira multicolorata TaxID=2654512 RepID=A0A833JCW5_9BACT|nr:pyridoxal-phosphate dependent enzyme [Fluviispira multicolorata]KAB8027988.1 pyridoxal-phosphate dependent enzyme [Fluviispira multicolorata]
MQTKNILEAIGRTPLVKINHLFKKEGVEVYAKCEFLNPGGSVKDRIGYQMVLDAQNSGRIKPGDILIEPTSGNTGIGIALAGAVLGYKVIITLPEKMSKEKQVVLAALGAEIIRTPTEAAYNAPESHISVANRLAKELPNAHVLDQYANPSNCDAHYNFTAQEIIDDLGMVPDYLVAGAGTGGTITGIAKKFKELKPSCQVIGCDPVGSILGGGTEVGTYQVEGIGYDFFPKVLDCNLIDKWIKTSDEPSFVWARKAIREEGFLCGGSSGTALFGVNEILHDVPKGSKIVVILPDGIRNYMTKLMDNDWLSKMNFKQAILSNNKFSK